MEFAINKFMVLKLEDGLTTIYVANTYFRHQSLEYVEEMGKDKAKDIV